MAFQEKSAWIMSFALLLGGLMYFGVVSSASTDLGDLAPPTIPLIALYTAILVAVAMIGHGIIAARSPSEAHTANDERERLIVQKAGHFSGYVFGVGVIVSLGFYLLARHGDLLFYGVFASLMLSQLAEYVIQIILHRTSV